MPTLEDKAEVAKVRDKVLLALGTRDLSTTELGDIIYPEAEHTNNDTDYARLFRVVKRLETEGKIAKKSLRGPWHLRAKPHVHDLPDTPKPRMGRPPGSKNGNGVVSEASGLRAYLLRDIRMKLDELEKLG